jgi:hypothetical protein
MKNTLLTIRFAGMAAILLSSFAFTQKSDETQEPQKNRHVRLVKVKGDKRMELDTVFTNNDVFVWNGDTINPARHFRNLKDGDFDIVRNLGEKDKSGNVMYFKHHKGTKGNPQEWQLTPGENMEIITEDIDSMGREIVIRKMMNDGNVGHMVYANGPDMKHFPPMPPMPPVPPAPHVKMFGIHHSDKIIDLNDSDIISYKKKEISGGREKIEIIRKKSTGNRNETLDFKFDDGLVAPEPPEFNWKSDNDSIQVKIIEKRKIIKGKDGKEIEVKVETEENK